MPVFVANGYSDPMILPYYSYLLAGLIPHTQPRVGARSVPVCDPCVHHGASLVGPLDPYPGCGLVGRSVKKNFNYNERTGVLRSANDWIRPV